MLLIISSHKPVVIPSVLPTSIGCKIHATLFEGNPWLQYTEIRIQSVKRKKLAIIAFPMSSRKA